MRYVFDAHFSRALPKILRALGIGADSIFDRFGEGKKDPEFLPQLDTDHDVFVTFDKHIHTRPAEAFALQEAGVRSLFFGPWWRDKRRWDQAAWLTANWLKVHTQVQQLAAGKWVWVRANGDLAEESEYPQKVRRQRRGTKATNPFPI